MRKALIVIGVLILAMAAQLNSFAAEQGDYDTDTSTPSDKFCRGAANTATFWAEIPEGMINEAKDTDPVMGVTVGLAKGLVNSIVCGVGGIYDMFTCGSAPYDRSPTGSTQYALKKADWTFRQYLW
ncbi:MAG: exosortase system-associated protein, TIGR04073 family [Candidatus Omnitrophota bacterium]